MLTLKNVIESAIEMGMETFEIHHIDYQGHVFEQTKDEVLDFINGYENAPIAYIQMGTGYFNKDGGKYIYKRPHHCAITFAD